MFLFLASFAYASPNSQAQLTELIRTYPDLSPEVVAARFEALSETQHELLGQWEMLGAHIATHICHGEAITEEAVLWESPSGTWTCAELLQNEAEAMLWGASATISAYIEQQKTEALFVLQGEPTS